MRRGIQITLWSAFALIAAMTAAAHAAIMYIGNGTVPDFPQVWSPTQQNKAICQAAAAADIMWYFDQHGYGGLVAHQDPKNPNNTWQQDGQALVYLMANYLYGVDPATGNRSNKGERSPLVALKSAIKAQGMYDGQKGFDGQNGNPNGLVVDYSEQSSASYANWVSGINNGGMLMAGVSWANTAGNTWLHAMTSAGVDPTNSSLIVTHGWDPHTGAAAPYLSPPPDMQPNPPFINQYPINVPKAGAKAFIPNPGDNSIDLFAGDLNVASGVSLYDFYNVHPKAKAKAAIKPKAGPGFDYTYDADVSNDSFEPIYEYIQQVQTPVDAMTAPPGWTAVPWNSDATPDVTALPLRGRATAVTGKRPLAAHATAAGPDRRSVLHHDRSHHAGRRFGRL